MVLTQILRQRSGFFYAGNVTCRARPCRGAECQAMRDRDDCIKIYAFLRKFVLCPIILCQKISIFPHFVHF
jgi:hypothetical protein